MKHWKKCKVLLPPSVGRGEGWGGAGDSCIVQLGIVLSVPSVPTLQLSQPSHPIFLSIRSFHSFRPAYLNVICWQHFCILPCSADISHFISTRVLYSVCDTNPNVCRANKIRKHLCLWLVWRICCSECDSPQVWRCHAWRGSCHH